MLSDVGRLTGLISVSWVSMSSVTSRTHLGELVGGEPVTGNQPEFWRNMVGAQRLDHPTLLWYP